MPRDDDKNNDSRGRRDRPSGGKGRSGAKRGPDKKFGKREGGRRARATASGAPMPESPTAPNPKAPGPMPRSPIPARASLTAIATAVRRAAMARARARAEIGRSRIVQGGIVPRVIGRNASTAMIVRRAARAVKNAPSRHAAIAAVATSGPLRRARTVAARNALPRGERNEGRPAARFSDKKFGERKPYAPRDRGGDKRPHTPRDRDGEKRPFTPRGEGFRRDGDRPPRRDFADRGDRKTLAEARGRSGCGSWRRAAAIFAVAR